MFSKFRKIALAAAAITALGAATLITSTESADARGGFSRGGGGGGGMRGGGFSRGGGGGGMRRISTVNRGGGGIRHAGGGGRWTGHRPGRPGWNHHRPRWAGHCRWGRCGGVYVNRYRRPWIYGVGVGAVAAPVAAYAAAPSYAVAPSAPAAPRCTCLQKEYTQDGLVVFQDVCTKEMASAPVGNTQAQMPQPGPQYQPGPQQGPQYQPGPQQGPQYQPGPQQGPQYQPR